MKHLQASLALWVGLAITGGQVRADPVVYMQPSNFPVQPGNGPGVYASQNDTTPGGLGNFATAYDNFTLAATTIITDVHWQGGYFLPPVIGPPFITAFTISFWSDMLGQPGNLLASWTILGNAGETHVGFENPLMNDGNEIYNYGTDLPTPFTAIGGVQYWLSIVPDLEFKQEEPFNGQWGWHTGTGGDGSSFQIFLDEPFVNPHDLAFSLTGVIPEPSSLALCGLAGAGLLGYRWCRRKRQAIA